MEEKSKSIYYKPTLEEIHIGYELWIKHYNSEEYKKLIIGDANWVNNMCDVKNIDGHHTIYSIPEGLFCKLLSWEDLIDNGWQHLGADWFEKEGYRLRKWVQYSIDIYRWYDDKDNTLIYRGNCKSINEYRTLMKWLKIY